jgi:hypothetical protein
MENPTRRLLILFTITVSTAIVAYNAIRADASVPPWKQFLGWLPVDTETLIVANGPFAVSELKDESCEFHKLATGLPIGPLFSFQSGMLGKTLSGQKITCAIEGSRSFTAPKKWGMMPYEGVHIVQFDDQSTDLVRKAFQECQAKAEKTIELAGQQVAIFTEKQEADIWTYFVVQPRQGLLMCGTNRKYIEDTLNRMTLPPAKRALPDDLPEWKQVDVKARVWAIRHFRKESRIDPSSPHNNESIIYSDSAAVGLVFWFGAKSDKVARVRYLSEATDALGIATKGWNDPSNDFTPTIRKTGNGSVEIVATITEDRATRAFVLHLLAYLGHGISL